MKCKLCNETRISDDNLADHFLENHFEETARAFFDMYSVSVSSEIMSAMASNYDEDTLCAECGDEDVDDEGDICDDCEKEEEEEEDE